MNLTELSKIVHKANEKWWQDIETGAPIKRNKGELIALIHSEISEMFDALLTSCNDDKLPHRLGCHVEPIDAIIRLLDYGVGFGHKVPEDFAAVEFDSLDKFRFIEFLSTSEIEYIEDLEAIPFFHFQLSKLLEFERKGNLDDAATQVYRCIAAIAYYCQRFGIKLQEIFNEKMEFNAKREDHTHEARRIAGGKQF